MCMQECVCVLRVSSYVDSTSMQTIALERMPVGVCVSDNV